ncbi:MAG TPA: DUF502 domain-containing protein [Bacteroidia bacterium]|nr:DUF502 domain-containing protein [Bacteroidia bacterium]
MNKIVRYFIQGLIITVPVIITVYVVFALISTIGSVVSKFGTIVNPFVDPFIVIFLTIILIFITGVMGSSIILRPLFIMVDNMLEHLPGIKTLYSSTKDFLGAFVGNKKRFNQPVLITINRENNIQQLGFVTQEDLSELNIAKGTIAVYVPLSYSLSGNLLIVPVDHITRVNASSSEVMKFIVSGGVTDIDESKKKD